MNRFHIVVFNYERITSFLDNFEKIRNFDADRDCLIIFDCSVNHQAELQKVIDFANRHGWSLGKEIHVIKRKNWGIDQGARIDYISRLKKTNNHPLYIWQFQEHYLDLTSSWSIWDANLPRIGGQVKGDVIPDGLAIDLDLCERVYQDNPSVSVIYADREKAGIFTHEDGRQWFYADGANFSARTTDVLRVFTNDVLDSYKAIYDGSYQWTLFMEFDICRQLTSAEHEWYDLVTHEHFKGPTDLLRLESEKNLSLHQEAEPFYPGLYRKYEQRFLATSAENKLWRKIHARLSLCYVDLLALRSMQRLKLVLEGMGLAVVTTRMRRYLTSVLKHQ